MWMHIDLLPAHTLLQYIQHTHHTHTHTSLRRLVRHVTRRNVWRETCVCDVKPERTWCWMHEGLSPHVWMYVCIKSHVWVYVCIKSHVWVYVCIKSHVWMYVCIKSHVCVTKEPLAMWLFCDCYTWECVTWYMCEWHDVCVCDMIHECVTWRMCVWRDTWTYPVLNGWMCQVTHMCDKKHT